MKKIIANLNKSFDNKVRLGIMSVLMVNEWVDFNTFKDMLDLTDGRLASHIKALEKDEYIIIEKVFFNKKPKTSYKASKSGKKAFNEHLNALEKLLKTRK